jgi:hypothetical protein
MAHKEETKLASKIKKSIMAKYGGKWTNLHGGIYQEVGMPDLIGCINGKYVAMEFKTPENKDGATEAQKKQIQDIINNQGFAKVITSVQEAFDFLDEIGIKSKQ